MPTWGKTEKSLHKLLIIHHNDMDGVVSAKIAEYYLLEDPELNFTKENTKFLCASYGSNTNWEELLADDTLVVILDFSIRPAVMEKFVERAHTFHNMIWIDHHISAIKEYKHWFPDSTFVPGIRHSGYFCGAELTWLYFNNYIFWTNNNEVSHGKDAYDLDVDESYEKLLNELPYPLRHVGDWDIWRWTPENPGGKYLNHVFSSRMDPYNINHGFPWEMFISHVAAKCYSHVFNSMITEGRVIDNYLYSMNNKVCTLNAYPKDFHGYKTIWLNSTNRSSTSFDAVKNDYELGIVYSFNGKKWTYSVYRLGLNPDKIIDCGDLCKTHFGGGGHASAAGFVIDCFLL